MGSTGSDNSLRWQDNLVVTDDMDDFIRANINNPDFKAWGMRKDVHSVDIENLWRELKAKEQLKSVHQIPIEEAVASVRDNVSDSVLSGWFRNADSSYKPALINQVLSNDVLNAGLNIAYYNYRAYMALRNPNETPLTFNKWLVTPQIMYRGEAGKSAVDSDIFMSYSPDRQIAEQFANYTGGTLHNISVRPIDTWGSYQTTSEQEFLVPSRVFTQNRRYNRQ